jgi:hypothetical protein
MSGSHKKTVLQSKMVASFKVFFAPISQNPEPRSDTKGNDLVQHVFAFIRRKKFPVL